MLILIASSRVYAAPSATCTKNATGSASDCTSSSQTPVPSSGEAVNSASPPATPDATELIPQNPDKLDTTTSGCAGDCNGAINKDLQILVNTLTIGVGVIVTMMIVVGGIQYMLSRDNPQAVQAAKTRIINAVLALVAFVFIWSFLQWIIPGGIL